MGRKQGGEGHFILRVACAKPRAKLNILRQYSNKTTWKSPPWARTGRAGPARACNSLPRRPRLRCASRWRARRAASTAPPSINISGHTLGPPGIYFDSAHQWPHRFQLIHLRTIVLARAPPIAARRVTSDLACAIWRASKTSARKWKLTTASEISSFVSSCSLGAGLLDGSGNICFALMSHAAAPMTDAFPALKLHTRNPLPLFWAPKCCSLLLFA